MISFFEDKIHFLVGGRYDWAWYGAALAIIRCRMRWGHTISSPAGISLRTPTAP